MINYKLLDKTPIKCSKPMVWITRKQIEEMYKDLKKVDGDIVTGFGYHLEKVKKMDDESKYVGKEGYIGNGIRKAKLTKDSLKEYQEMDKDMEKMREEFDAICGSYNISEEDYNQLIALARWIQ